jgi:predicted RNase H-like HicB family nuclease
MSREFNVIIERDAEGCYVGSVPALDELMVRVREAIELCLDFVGVQKVTVG